MNIKLDLNQWATKWQDGNYFSAQSTDKIIETTQNLFVHSMLCKSATHDDDRMKVALGMKNFSTQRESQKYSLLLKISAVFSFVLIGLIPYLFLRNINQKIDAETQKLNQCAEQLEKNQHPDFPRNKEVEAKVLEQAPEWFKEADSYNTDEKVLAEVQGALTQYVDTMTPLEVDNGPPIPYVREFYKDCKNGISYLRVDGYLIDVQPHKEPKGMSQKEAAVFQAQGLDELISNLNDMKWRNTLQTIVGQGPVLSIVYGYLTTFTAASEKMQWTDSRTKASYFLSAHLEKLPPIKLIIHRDPKTKLIMNIEVNVTSYLSLVQYQFSEKSDTQIYREVGIVKPILSSHCLKYNVRLDENEKPHVFALKNTVTLNV